jgi:hypothetical protein
MEYQVELDYSITDGHLNLPPDERFSSIWCSDSGSIRIVKRHRNYDKLNG